MSMRIFDLQIFLFLFFTDDLILEELDFKSNSSAFLIDFCQDLQDCDKLLLRTTHQRNNIHFSVIRNLLSGWVPYFSKSSHTSSSIATVINVRKSTSSIIWHWCLWPRRSLGMAVKEMANGPYSKGKMESCWNPYNPHPRGLGKPSFTWTSMHPKVKDFS